MTPTTGTALLLLVAFVLPGFVAQRVAEKTHVVARRLEAFDRLLLALYYSAFIYATVATTYVIVEATGLYRFDTQDRAEYLAGRDIWEPLLAGVIIMFVLPVPVALAGHWWRLIPEVRQRALGALGINPGHEVPSAWDAAFMDTLEPRYVRVVMNDGRVIGGYFSEGSFAPFSEQDSDLFISERWELDDDWWFKAVAPGTRGIWLARDRIASIEFYTAEEETSQLADITATESDDEHNDGHA